MTWECKKQYKLLELMLIDEIVLICLWLTNASFKLYKFYNSYKTTKGLKRECLSPVLPLQTAKSSPTKNLMFTFYGFHFKKLFHAFLEFKKVSGSKSNIIKNNLNAP